MEGVALFLWTVGIFSAGFFFGWSYGSAEAKRYG
jgi:hypothetical protein